jgi:hypothetical protein
MPCSLAYHKNEFHWDTLCNTLRTLGCSTEENCGLHVHFSRKFTVAQEKKIYWFIYKHIEKIIKIAGRRPNNFARVNNDPCETGFDDRKNDRYTVLNFTNKNTIEFRLPKGTLDYTRIYAILEFLDAAIRYTKNHTLSFIKVEPWESFIDWIKNSKSKQKKYSNILSLIQTQETIVVSDQQENTRAINVRL